MLNVSGTGWMPQEAERILRFEFARPRLLLCAFAEQPVVGVLNTLEVKTRHAAGATLRIRQDGEDLFNGEISAERGDRHHAVDTCRAGRIARLLSRHGSSIIFASNRKSQRRCSRRSMSRGRASSATACPSFGNRRPRLPSRCTSSMARTVRSTRAQPPVDAATDATGGVRSCCASSHKVRSPRPSRRARFKWPRLCRA